MTSELQNHVTQKLGRISKIWPEHIQISSSSLRISSHLPAHIENGGEDTFLKWPNFQLSRSHDLDLDLGAGHTAYRCASLVALYLHTKLHSNQGKPYADERRDAHTYVRTDGNRDRLY